MFCISCGSKVPTTARFCAKCGHPIEVGDPDATVLGDVPASDANLETIAPDALVPSMATPRQAPSYPRPRSSPPSNPALTSSDPIGGGRFAPGTIVADRYRIVALLGRGGMGEVYRAEDLRLSQVLAIKFLPEALSRDEGVLARFHSEVRVARQVSHPNVCRVFDIGDVDGLPFLTMEYVDGEDLSSLVRRIGRLPQDKAIEVSRQICAGLAAAHERGVVHRDLKPANVMLDGAGKARIADFGLAGIAANIQGSEVRAGTPAYMAPEQLAGEEVTIKSDIFSLGLVMYELLTGRRAYEAMTLPELMKSRNEGKITNPSAIVKDLDPLVERVILRCLERDPAKRPASALQVAAALPGGDPLAAALAAGETPSPEMVAAAGSNEGMPPRLALACLLSALALLAACTYLGIRESGLKRIHPQYSTELLEHKAREIVATLGYPAPAHDSASGFTYDYDYLSYLTKKEKPGGTWNRVLGERPSLLQFWYRQSPQEMITNGYSNVSLTPGVVTFSDPPAIFSGMVNARLDHTGRLLYFQAIPPEKEGLPQTTKTLDWQPLFAAAGLNLSEFQSTTPAWNTLASADERGAWDGKWPGSNRPLHVEAAALHGLPVYFELSGPWTSPSRMPPPESTASERAGEIFGMCFIVFLVCGGIWLAYRNYSRGKGDRRGAWKLASVVLLVETALFLALAHLKLSGDSLFLLLLAVSTGLFLAGFMWILYLALEPYVRSKWPQTIVSWSRLLAGKMRDPLVGRDILYGTVLGLAWVLVFYAGHLFDMRAGERPLLPQAEILEGNRAAFSMWLGNIVGAIVGVLIFFFVLVFFRALVRNRWLAAVLFVLVFAIPKILATNHPLVDSPVWIIIYLIAAIAVVRFGLVVLATAVFTANLLLNVPYTLDFAEWYAPASISMVLSVVALAGWGFYTALAGQRLVKEELFD
jgi:Protein kinase domain/zinc-ribbon domain